MSKNHYGASQLKARKPSAAGLIGLGDSLSTRRGKKKVCIAANACFKSVVSLLQAVAGFNIEVLPTITSTVFNKRLNIESWQ